ncbi:MAG: MarR family transcriptional regulator [Hyphomonadaceae bacterium]
MATTTTGNTAFALNTSPSHLLHRAQQLAATQSAEALKSAGITLRQFSVLAALSGAEGASQSRIVDMTGVDRSTLADMIARMEASGLVRRKLSKEDRRAKSVILSAKGRRILTKAAPAVSEADENLLAALPKNRRGSFLAILSVLAETADVEILHLEAEEPAPKPKPKPKAKPAKAKVAKAAKPKKAKAAKAAKPKKKAVKPKKKTIKKKKKT